MNTVIFLANATISFFMTFISASLEFLFAEIWKIEKRRAFQKIRLGVGASAFGNFRSISCGYGLVYHPLGNNDLLLKGTLSRSWECPSCKEYSGIEKMRFSNFIFKIVEGDKPCQEVESELILAEEHLCRVFEDLFDDAYAEVGYVIYPRKWPQPDR